MRKAGQLLRWSSVVIVCLLAAIVSCAEKKKESTKEVEAKEVVEVQQPFFKLSLAQWSLNKAVRFEGQSPLDFAQKASEMGFEGLEYVSQLYTKELEKDADPKVAMETLLKTLKEKSETYKVENLLIMVDGEGHLATLNDEERAQTVENHKKWVDAAKFLGCHSIRVNAHGEGSYEEVAEAAAT